MNFAAVEFAAVKFAGLTFAVGRFVVRSDHAVVLSDVVVAGVGWSCLESPHPPVCYWRDSQNLEKTEPHLGHKEPHLAQTEPHLEHKEPHLAQTEHS